MTQITSLTNIENTLAYLMNRLHWPISEDSPAVDPYEVNWEYYPEDLGLKDSDFAKITTLQQMKPLSENQAWAVFFVEFDAKKMQITVLRKILGALIFNKRNTDHKIWDKENLLFVCFWGEAKNRTIGFIHFNESVKGLPTLKALYFEPQNEAKEVLARYEAQLSHLNWEYAEKCDEWTLEWKKAFTTEYGKVIRDTARLTTELAHSAQKIRKQILDVLEVENENGYVHKLLKKFKDMLVHDMNESTFADMYAQTISYGLFSARCMNVEEEIFDPLKAIDNIPDTNPFLRQLLREGLDAQKGNVKNSISFDELELAGIIDLLQNTDMKAIVQDFNRQSRSGREDPVIHFYEDFLTEYDKEEKVNRGVFYTPLPVVDFIVRSVDSILKTEFGIKEGLACDERIIPDGRKKNETVPRVQILDPATGTGTFLRQTILQIKKNFDASTTLSNLESAGTCSLSGVEGNNATWSRYVTLSLLHRLYGFELMMAPYAVAHMKIAMALQETGYNFASATRLKLFLTNSLEEAGDASGMRSLFEEDPIAVEATQANRVKKEARINVVMGNPPYSVSSNNKSQWILDLIQDYKKDLNEKNIQPLSDDYIKFIRLGEEYISKQNAGILAYISNNSFVDGLIHRQMRKHLLESFDDIYILNLHGNSKKKETCPDGSKDENVFDIQQGVSINIFVKKGSKKKSELANVFYADLFGERAKKFEFLSKTDFANVEWEKVDFSEPRFYFVPKDFSANDEYEKGFKIDEMMQTNGSGIKFRKDNLLVHFSKNEVITMLDDIHVMSASEFITKYNFKETDDWKLFEKKVLFNSKDYDSIEKVYYRPFDIRYCYYPIERISQIIPRGDSRKNLMYHMKFNNYALLACKGNRQISTMYFSISGSKTDLHYLDSSSDSMRVFPLFLYDEGYGTRRPNLNDKIVAEIKKTVGEFEPLNLLDYIYAVLHTPSYRTKYKEFLKIDFPRIPYPTNKEQFFALAKIGGELRELHLMKSAVIDETPVTFSGTSPSQEVTTRKYNNGKVWINKTEYFDGIPESAWNFYIGGYQVADKWLKDRKGRTLSKDEIKHYGRIIKVLMETERLMSELDKMWTV